MDPRVPVRPEPILKALYEEIEKRQQRIAELEAENERLRERLRNRSRERHMLTSNHQVKGLKDGGVMAGRLPWETCEAEPCPSDRAAFAPEEPAP